MMTRPRGQDDSGRLVSNFSASDLRSIGADDLGALNLLAKPQCRLLLRHSARWATAFGDRH